MGIQRMIDVTCDVKGCYEVTDASEWTAAEARRSADQAGWLRRRGKDICPLHDGVLWSQLVFDD